MTRTLTIERQFHSRSLYIVPAIHDIFARHQLEWMARSVGRYSKDLCASSTLLTEHVSEVFWIGGLIPPNRHHLHMFESMASGWISLCLPLVVSHTVQNTDANKVPSPSSFTIGGM